MYKQFKFLYYIIVLYCTVLYYYIFHLASAKYYLNVTNVYEMSTYSVVWHLCYQKFQPAILCQCNNNIFFFHSTDKFQNKLNQPTLLKPSVTNLLFPRFYTQ
jgi:hypothetical protein